MFNLDCPFRLSTVYTIIFSNACGLISDTSVSGCLRCHYVNNLILYTVVSVYDRPTNGSRTLGLFKFLEHKCMEKNGATANLRS